MDGQVAASSGHECCRRRVPWDEFAGTDRQARPLEPGTTQRTQGETMETTRLQTLGRNFRSRHQRNREQQDLAERSSNAMHLILTALTVATACLVWVVGRI